MARVTVEDCLKNVKNRFELVLLAAKRARQLMRGKEAKVEWDNDKSTVVALREIAAGYTDVSSYEAHDDSMLHIHLPHSETHVHLSFDQDSNEDEDVSATEQPSEDKAEQGHKSDE